MDTIEQALARVAALGGEGAALRRRFHRYPETGWTEFGTTAEIAAYLEEYGIPVRMGRDVIAEEAVMGRPAAEELAAQVRRAAGQVSARARPYIDREEGYTGLMAVIDSGRPGPVVALRFDIDANGRTESADAEHLPARLGFASENPGAQHACGHDGHIVIGLLTARVLQECKARFRGKVKILFQPAEEFVRGAKAMAEKGLLDDADYFFSGHLGFDTGSVGTLFAGSYGMLATTKLDALFTGVGAHSAAAPEQGHNALLAAASAVFAVSSADHDGRGASMTNVGVMEAGSARNVIPDRALLKLETRGATTEINDQLCERVLRCAAAMYGCTVEIRQVGASVTAASDGELQDFVAETAERYGLYRDVRKDYRFPASEDAAVLMRRVQAHGGKACFSIWGTPVAAPHHHARFDFDEAALVPAAALTVACALRKTGYPC